MNWTWPVGVVAAGVLAFSLTRLVLWWLERRGMLDVPNVRSSHTVPTPRGGGIALVAAITVAWTWGAAMGTAAATATAIVLGLGLGLAALSFRDDVRALPVLIRVGGQIAVVAVGTAALPADGLVFQGLLPLVADRALAALVWLWFVNLYNFMDGIDGITGIETFSIGVGLFLAMTLAAGPGDVAYGGLCTAAAAVGFLWWNRHPARIFLGDVGQYPARILGRVVAALRGRGRPLGAGLALAALLPRRCDANVDAPGVCRGGCVACTCRPLLPARRARPRPPR